MSVSWLVDVAVSGGPSVLLMVKVNVLKQNGRWHATCPFPDHPKFHVVANTFDELIDAIPAAWEQSKRSEHEIPQETRSR